MDAALQIGSRESVGYQKAGDVYPFVEAYLKRREAQIAEILQLVERYEAKRMKEEQAYRGMSSLRRLLSGKKPDHHVAVEYIHYVKKPMEKVKRLRKDMEIVKAILEGSKPDDLINLPEDIERELV
jgi:hypothetical protein